MLTDNERFKKAIPIVNDGDFYLKHYPNDSNYIYQYKVKNLEKPYHRRKTVYYNSTSLLQEEDAFRYRINEDLAFTMIVKYDFTSQEPRHFRLITFKEISEKGKEYFTSITDTF